MIWHFRLAFWSETDLEKFGPALASDEEAIPDGIIRDAIEDIGHGVVISGLEQAAKINQADEIACRWINPSDEFGLPDVGEDFAFDIFQLVEPGHRPAMIGNMNRPLDLKGGRL